MKLRTVSARGLKGLAFTLTLQDINFFVGSNFRGKSARTDAIRLALLGYLPELGKTNAATFKLASGKELVIEATLDDGRTISRRWFLKGDAVKYVETVPPEFEGNNPIIAAMMDPAVYFGLSERDRVAFVASHVTSSGADATADSLIADLDEALGTDPEINAEARRKYAGYVRGVRVEWEGTAGELSLQSFLDFALDHAIQYGWTAKDFAGRMDKTAAGLTYLRTQDAPGADLPALNALRAGLEREVETLRAEKAKHHGAYLQQIENRRRRDALTAELAARPALVVRRDAAEKALHALTSATAPVTIPPEDVQEIAAEARAADLALAGHHADLRNVLDSVERNRMELAELGAKQVCPYCGAVGTRWKSIKEAEIRSALQGLDAKRDQLMEHICKVKEHAANMNRKADNMRTLIALKTTHERDIQNARLKLSEAERALAGYEGKAADLAAIPAHDPAVVEAVEKAQTALTVKLGELHENDRLRTAAMGRASELKRLADAEKNRDEGKEDEAVAKAACAYFRERKAKIVDEAFGPLLATANAIFGAVLRTPIAYHEGEIGTWRDGVWVSHLTLSGAEKALTYAAIQAALASRSPSRVMVIDELNRIHDDNMPRFLGCLEDAVRSGLIGQFFGIDTRDRYSAAEIDAQVLTITEPAA